jgi:hypothetical protein
MRQLGYDCGASPCLEKLLTNNQGLLETAVGEETVRVFVELIKDKGPEAIFLQFMSALCSCKGKQIVSNQEHMLRVLYSFCATNDNIAKAKADDGGDGDGGVANIVYGDCAHNRNELLMDTCLDFNTGGADGSGECVDGGVSRPLREWGAVAEEPERYLGKELFDSGMRDIRVSWSCTDVWDGELDDTLFYSPTGLGLGTFVRPTEESNDLARSLKADGFSAPRHLTDYVAAAKTIAKAQNYEPDAAAGEAKREWVRLEELVWPLDPERCYPLVFAEQIAHEKRTGGESGATSLYHFADSWGEFKEQVVLDSRLTFAEARGADGAEVVETFARHTQIAEYYLANLELMAEMALGRSYNCLHALEHHFSYDLLLTGMTNEALPFSIRRAYTDLVLRLWVDRYPHTPLQVPQEVRVLSEIYERPVDEEGRRWVDQPNTLPCFQIEENNPILKFEGEKQFVDFYTIPDGDKFHLLEDFVSDHFNALKLRMVFEDQQKSRFTKAVIGVLEKLSVFGFFADTGEVAEIVDPLIGLLDGRGDCLSDFEAVAQDAQELEALHLAVDGTKRSMAKGRQYHWGATKREAPADDRRLSMKDVTARRSMRRASILVEKEKAKQGLGTLAGGDKATKDTQRYLITEESERVMASKVNMCRVSTFFQNVQLDFRLGALLAKIKDSIGRKRTMTGERQSTMQNALYRIYEGAADPEGEQFEEHMAFATMYAKRASMPLRYTHAMDIDYGSDTAGREEGTTTGLTSLNFDVAGGMKSGVMAMGGGLNALKNNAMSKTGLTKMTSGSDEEVVLDLHVEHGDAVSTLDAEEGYCLTQQGFTAVQTLFGSMTRNLDIDHLAQAPLVTVCLDLQQYESADLFVASMTALVDHFTQRRQLREHIGQIQLLTNEFSINAHEELRDNLAMLTNDLESYEMWGVANEFSGVDDSVVQRVLVTLDSLVTLCVQVDGTPDKENQDLFGNMRVHNTVLKALDIPIDREELKARTGHLYEIKSLCYRFLRDFVIDHESNQTKVFKYLQRSFDEERERRLSGDNYSYHFGHGFCMSELVAATFRNNRKLSTIKSRKLGGSTLQQAVERFLDLIKGEGSANGVRFLKLFNDVVQVDGSVLRVNQEMILTQLTAPKYSVAGGDGALGDSKGSSSGSASGPASSCPKETVLQSNEVCLLLLDRNDAASTASTASTASSAAPAGPPVLGRALTTNPNPLESDGFRERQRLCRNFNPVLVGQMPAPAAAPTPSSMGGGEEVVTMGNPLVTNGQSCHDSNRLAYHCQVVELLATCSKRNQVTQVRVQQLLPLDIVFAVLSDSSRDSHPIVRKAFCKFLNAAYLHTEIDDYADTAVAHGMLRPGGVVETLLTDIQQYTSEAAAALATGAAFASDAEAPRKLTDGRERALTASMKEVRTRKSTAVQRAEKDARRSRKSEELKLFGEYIFTAALPMLTAVARRWPALDESGKMILDEHTKLPRWRPEMLMAHEADLLSRLQESVRGLIRSGAYGHSAQRHSALQLGAALRMYDKDAVDRLLQNARAAEVAAEEEASGGSDKLSVERDVLRRFVRAMGNSREYAQAEAVEWRQLVGTVLDGKGGVEQLTDPQHPDFVNARTMARGLKAKELLGVTADGAGGANLAHIAAQGQGRVKIRGLVAKPELNGTYGTAIEFKSPDRGDPSVYRYTVQLDGGSKISLKPENVLAVKADGSSAGGGRSARSSVFNAATSAVSISDGAGNPMHGDGSESDDDDDDDEEDVLDRAERWAMDEPWARVAEAAMADRRRNKITTEMVVVRIVKHMCSPEGLNPKVTPPQLAVDMMRLLRGMLEAKEFPMPEEFEDREEDNSANDELNEDEMDELRATYTGMQDDFDHWGVSYMIVDVISEHSSTDEMVIGAMELCCAMLNGGNKMVQETIYGYLVENNNDSFFERMHDRLRRAVTAMELRRKKQKDSEKGLHDHLQIDTEDRDLDGTGLSHVERLAQGFVSESADGENADVPPDELLLEPEEFDPIRMDLVGRMLQLFAEGHNLSMQNIMRSQQQNRAAKAPNDGANGSGTAEAAQPVNFKMTYNLVQDAVDLLAVTASNDNQGAIASLDDDDAEDLEKVIDFLIEVMQGPCQRNQAMLAESGMVEICVNLITLLPTYAKNYDSGVFEVVDGMTGVSKAADGYSDGEAGPEVVSEDWSKKVKSVAAKALSSLLEGSGADKTVQGLLMDILPPKLVRDRLVRVYQNFEDHRVAFDNQVS